jgi:tRNA dimethylallyltransferase
MAPDRFRDDSAGAAAAPGGTTLPCGDGAAGQSARKEPPRRPVLGDDCWILSGPTASGKTSLGLRLARQLDAEIVSVDSMAVYRSLDIGTAKPSPEEREAVRHHLVDMVDPGESYSVARWLADAAAAVDAARAAGHRVLFVGGTPLYLRALRDGLDAAVGEDHDFRHRLAEEAEQSGPEVLHARLAAVDPAAAARIHPRDLRRIIRGLEIVRMTGRPASASWASTAPPPRAFAEQMMIRDLPRRLLASRIDRRVEAMFAAGLVEETRAAVAGPGGIGPTAAQAAGYTEALAVLAGRLTVSEAVVATQRRTRQLAKRQLTWLRSFKSAVWLGA